MPPRSADLLPYDEAAQASVAGAADGLGSGRRALAAVRALFQLVQGGDVSVQAWPVARGTPKKYVHKRHAGVCFDAVVFA